MGRVRAGEGRNVLFYFGIDVIPERIKVVPVVARKIQLSFRYSCRVSFLMIPDIFSSNLSGFSILSDHCFC